ncbi:MAG: tetratricopeptide repeat protein [Phycisphaerae bacterium]
MLSPLSTLICFRTDRRWPTLVVAWIVVLPVVATQAGQQPTSAPSTTQPALSLQDADDLWLKGDYAAAAEQYRALAGHPDSALAATVGLARCGLMTGTYRDALAELDRVAALGRSSADWLTVRAELLARVGQYDEALGDTEQAIELEPAKAYRARNLRGRLLERTGKRDQAIETYAFFDRLMTRKMPITAEGITEAAQGFFRYSVLTRHPNLAKRTQHTLWEMLQVAYERVDRNYWPARLAAADLLRDKYNFAQATEDYHAALKINPNLPQVQVGLGSIALEQWRFEGVEKHVLAALKVDPNYAPAHNLRASSRIVERRYDQAIESCRKVLEVNPRDFQALSLAAAACRCKYDFQGVKQYEEKVRQINPRCATYYYVMGDALSGLRQYADSEAAFRQSIEYEPTNANARTELGLMLMQWGLEDKAFEVLEGAWALDEFNERTFNTLDLLKKLEAFGRLDTEHFIIRFDELIDWPAARQLARAAEDIYEDICADYETELARKTVLEIFPTHRDFGVRITGKPWIHTVGACTGWVIALDSPRADPQTKGPFHMARVLRHEFIHVVTLALTENRIAHWFTEGLAVHGEGMPRSLDWQQLLAQAIRQNRLFTLESVDWGFVRPQRPNDRTLAYAQSEWMVEYIVDTYGYDALGQMLAKFKEAKPQPQVFREALGVEPAEFDKAFLEWALPQARRWGLDLTSTADLESFRQAVQDNPEDAAAFGRLAQAELDHGHTDKAMQAAQKAVDLDQNQVQGMTVLVEGLEALVAGTHNGTQRADIHARMLPHLKRLVQLHPDGWVAPQLLGEIALAKKQFDQAADWFNRLRRLRPDHPSSYRGLAGIYLRRGQLDQAVPVLIELARLDEYDAEVPANLANIFAGQDRLGDARYWYRQSLYINPFNSQTYRKLAQVQMRDNDTAAALETYQVLCSLQPDRAENFAGAAFACRKLGQHAKAADYAAKAVGLDPESPAKTLLNSDN